MVELGAEELKLVSGGLAEYTTPQFVSDLGCFGAAAALGTFLGSTAGTGALLVGGVGGAAGVIAACNSSFNYWTQ
jgi:hypothetical protein